MLEWLQIHYVEIFAIVGALYTAARFIVVLTPTPKDDAAVKRVGVWLKAIGKAFGLDLTQGVHGGMGGAGPGAVSIIFVSGILCAAMVATMAPGCAPAIEQNPRAKLVASQTTFAAIVRSLATLRRAGKFNPEEVEAINVAIHKGDEYLDAWEQAVIAGNDAPDIIVAFNEVLQALIDYQLMKGGG